MTRRQGGLSLMVCLGLGVLTACAPRASSTAEIPPVRNFELSRYLGVWYEIARLPHRFERGMSRVRATYSRRKDGSIRVENQGFRDRDGKPHRIEGVAHMKGAENVGELRVSFFRPFYGDYKIIFLAGDYSSAIVTSSTKDYLWILSRSPTMNQKTLQAYLEKIRNWGFDLSRIEIKSKYMR